MGTVANLKKDDFFLPEKAINNHLAILGKTGSGKTYTSKGIAERLMRQNRRVCIVDPTGAWWGIKSSADGKKAGFPAVIFGGDHADFPIGRNHGAAIAEIVATTEICSIIDTSLMSVGDRTQFFSDFAETLLRKNREPLHLILDEAHNFAPQGKVPNPQAGVMLHATNNLLSMGRSRGLRIMMISQRPQKLHKDSLTQAETLIAMRLMHNLDRKSVEDWIGEWADKSKGAEILKSLPSLKTGTGWVWFPEMDILKFVEFPKISTYDSSRAPEGEQAKVVLAGVDMASIEAKLETAAVQVLNDDPKRLRKRILELEAELKKKAPAVAPAIDPKAIQEAEDRGYQQGLKHFELVLKMTEEAREILSRAITIEMISPRPKHTPIKLSVTPPAAMQKPDTAKAIKDMAVHAQKAMEGDLSKYERKLLIPLAHYGTCTKARISAYSGGSIKSSTFANNLSSLRVKGLIDGYGDDISITEAGRAAMGDLDPLPTGEELQSVWLAKLEKAPREILRAMFAQGPGTIFTKDAIADISAYSETSSTFANALSTLRTLELISGYKENIKVSDEFFS